MLWTRLWMGTVLIALTAGVLVLDNRLAPWYPYLFLFVLVLSLVACYELLHLLEPARRPSGWLCYLALIAMILANWVPVVLCALGPDFYDLDVSSAVHPEFWGFALSAWRWLGFTFGGIVLATFLVEMIRFREPGQSVARIALTLWIIAYLGWLPSYLIQLRWPSLYSLSGPYSPYSWPERRTDLALALAIFVPKCCDIGAYFTGRLLGRHHMAPVLSPKKTWEGAVGGLTAAVLAAFVISQRGPVVRGGTASAVGLGLALGIAGMIGDLAESLIKRDCERKDASQAVPGFGGVLDVVDSILFAAPVAHWWLQ